MAFWILTGVLLGVSLATLRRLRSEGLLSERAVVAVPLAWVAFAVLQLSLLPRAEFLNPGDLPVAHALAAFLTLPPLVGATLSIWAFGRLRHQ